MRSQRAVLLSKLQNRAHMLFGDDEHMHRRFGVDIQKGQHLFILIYFLGGNFSRNDLAENTILHFYILLSCYGNHPFYSSLRCCANILRRFFPALTPGYNASFGLTRVVDDKKHSPFLFVFFSRSSLGSHKNIPFYFLLRRAGIAAAGKASLCPSQGRSPCSVRALPAAFRFSAFLIFPAASPAVL